METIRMVLIGYLVIGVSLGIVRGFYQSREDHAGIIDSMLNVLAEILFSWAWPITGSVNPKNSR